MSAEKIGLVVITLERYILHDRPRSRTSQLPQLDDVSGRGRAEDFRIPLAPHSYRHIDESSPRTGGQCPIRGFWPNSDFRKVSK